METQDAVLQAGFWNVQASLHQSAILALQLCLEVMEVDNCGVLLPIGFQEEVDAQAAKTWSLQRVMALEYMGALDLDLDMVTANMSLAYKRRPPETGATEDGPSNGDGTMEGERRKRRKQRWREILEDEDDEDEEVLEPVARKQKENTAELQEKDAEEVEQELETGVEPVKEKEKGIMEQNVATMNVDTVETLGKEL